MKPAILCVDDYSAGLDAMRKLLEHAGFCVTATSDPSSVVELANHKRFDAVVLDFQMPEANGSELARLLKQQRPKLPVLLLSAYSAAIPQDATNWVDCFLSKGQQTARELPAAIKRLIDAGHASQQETVDQLRTAAKDALQIDEGFAQRLQIEER